jgi:hypothetical protein
MPEFTTEIDIEPHEYVYECSKRELQELIDELVEKGLVVQISTPHEKQPNLLEIEWMSNIAKLSTLRQRVTLEEEQTIKDLVSKYI